MYKSEFDNLVRQNKTFKAYMFYGQCNYLIESYALKTAQQFASDNDIEKIYYDEYNFKACKEKLLQSSLFASSNVLLIKLEKKLPKNEVEELIKACNTNENSYVIFACMKDSEFKTMQNYFTLKNSAVGVRFFSLFAKEAMQLLEQEAKLLNLKYDVSALHHLYFMHRNDLSLCMNDLKKLSIVDEIITSKVVNQHCFGFGAVSLEEFLYKLLSKQIINEDVNALLNEGANEIYLITQITAYIQQLFMINAYIKTNGRADAKEILGFMPPKKIWDDKCKIAMSIKPTEFLRMFEFMNGLELELKTLKINDQNAYLQASLRKFTVLFR